MHYSENTSLRLIGVIMMAVSVVAIVVGFIVQQPFLLLGFFTVFIGLTIFSIGLYNRITVSDTELRVGRNRVALTDLETGFGAVLENKAESQGQRTQLLGGSYSPPLGTKKVIVKKTDGGLLAVASWHAVQLTSALNKVLGHSKS